MKMSDKSTFKVCVIVPNWNGMDFLAPCLDSLVGQTVPAHVIVVENGSKDGSVAFIKEKYPEVILLEQLKNLGFAGGVNVGLRYAIDNNYTFAALFNNDAVAKPDWLETLLEGAEKHPKAGIVTGKLLLAEGKEIECVGEVFYTWGIPAPRGRGEKDTGQYDKAEFVFGASGGASLYRLSALQQVGLFDEAFFAYYEDVDISFRAQLQGWQVYYEPKAIAYHRMGQTSQRIKGFHAYHAMKNLPLLYWKNMPSRLVPASVFRFLIMYSVSLLGAFRNYQGLAALKGILKSLWLLPKALAARFHIQHSRTVDANYIRSLLTAGMPPGANRLAKLFRVFGVKT